MPLPPFQPRKEGSWGEGVQFFLITPYCLGSSGSLGQYQSPSPGCSSSNSKHSSSLLFCLQQFPASFLLLASLPLFLSLCASAFIPTGKDHTSTQGSSQLTKIMCPLTRQLSAVDKLEQPPYPTLGIKTKTYLHRNQSVYKI